MQKRVEGFTLVELLTVLAIITMLVGLLTPAIITFRKAATETKQKAQLSAIAMALTAFRNDYGDYPPSTGWDLAGPHNYGGAQKLAEALMGQDLLGFHPQTGWDAGSAVYDRFANPDTLEERRGPYLDLSTIGAFKVRDILSNNVILAPDTFVLCDAFRIKKIRLIDGSTARAGSPVLYYRANQAGRSLTQIYNNLDNAYPVNLGRITDQREHPLAATGGTGGHQGFYDRIIEPRINTVVGGWPVRDDSYILITAGSDGLYGNADDICNFGL
jgi:prepilin-type N-terminal cleavage/methylation domain-containing protein